MSPSQRNNLADDLRSLRVMSVDQYVAMRERDAKPLDPWKVRIMRSIQWGAMKPCSVSWGWIDLALDVTKMYAETRAAERRKRRDARAARGGRS